MRITPWPSVQIKLHRVEKTPHLGRQRGLRGESVTPVWGETLGRSCRIESSGLQPLAPFEVVTVALQLKSGSVLTFSWPRELIYTESRTESVDGEPRISSNGTGAKSAVCVSSALCECCYVIDKSQLIVENLEQTAGVKHLMSCRS